MLVLLQLLEVKDVVEDIGLEDIKGVINLGLEENIINLYNLIYIN
jgi:hypothetical protein